MLSVVVSGRSLRAFGPYGGVEYTTTHRGSGTASWRMDPDRHRSLRAHVGGLVSVFSHGHPLFTGYLDEPGTDGTYHASGLPTRADRVLAIDGSGNPTVDEPTATAQAIARGLLPGWREPGQMGAWTGDPEPGMTLAQLYDAIHEPQSLLWLVTPRGTLTTYSPLPKSTPDFNVTLPGYRFGWSTEGLASTVTGYFMDDVSSFDDVTLSTGIYGGAEEWVDLTPQGILTSGEAATALQGIIDSQGVALPTPTERIELPPGTLRSRGFQTVGSHLIAGGDTLRIWGATDGRSGAGYLDVRVADTAYTADTDTAVVTPAHMVPRGFQAAMQEALST